MPTSASTLKFFRQSHRWIGLFIAPSLMFFALTGALQTFSLHEASTGSSYKPSGWILTLAQIHKNQTDILKKPKPVDNSVRGDKPAAVATATVPAAPPAPVKPKWQMHLPLKIFFLIVALGLFTSTLTGIFMAYRYGGSKVVVTVLLAAGAVVPLILLKF